MEPEKYYLLSESELKELLESAMSIGQNAMSGYVENYSLLKIPDLPAPMVVQSEEQILSASYWIQDSPHAVNGFRVGVDWLKSKLGLKK